MDTNSIFHHKTEPAQQVQSDLEPEAKLRTSVLDAQDKGKLALKIHFLNECVCSILGSQE